MKGEFDLIEPSAARVILVEAGEAVLPRIRKACSAAHADSSRRWESRSGPDRW